MRESNIRNKPTIVEIKNKQKKLRLNVGKIATLTKKILKSLDQKGKGLSILLCDDKAIKKINKRFLNKNSPTDVIAFNSCASFLGDIAVSVETAKKNAKLFNTGTEYEIMLYIAHGILHILGYDDSTTTKKKKMFKAQERLLKSCLSKKLKVLY